MTTERFELLRQIRRACEARGLELEILSSHPTAKRPLRNGPVEWVDICVTMPGHAERQLHCSTIEGGNVVAFLKATLAEIHREWPRTAGGPNATHANRQAKRARLEAEQRRAAS